jgi:hypothetical protein
MKRLVMALALSLVLVGCEEAATPVVTPVATSSPTTAPIVQPVRMESDVHAYGATNFWVYFVTYQSLGRDTSAKLVDVEWDCFPPQPPDHPHAFYSVPVIRVDDKLSYDGQTLRLAPAVPDSSGGTGILVGTIRADGSWVLLEKDTGLYFTFTVAKDTPDSIVKKYQDAPCSPPPSK